MRTGAILTALAMSCTSHSDHPSLTTAPQENGNLINEQEKERGYTALHIAAQLGFDAIVRELLIRGANPNILDKVRAMLCLHAFDACLCFCFLPGSHGAGMMHGVIEAHTPGPFSMVVPSHMIASCFLHLNSAGTWARTWEVIAHCSAGGGASSRAPQPVGRLPPSFLLTALLAHGTHMAHLHMSEGKPCDGVHTSVMGFIPAPSH